MRAWDISHQTDSDQSVLLEPFVLRGEICLRQLKSDSGIPFSVRSKTFVVPMASIRMLNVIRLMSVAENLWLQHSDSAVSQMMDSLSNAKLILGDGLTQMSVCEVEYESRTCVRNEATRTTIKGEESTR